MKITPLRKICFVEKGYNIDKHINDYKDLYPTEFIIKYLDEKEFKWQKELDSSGKSYYIPDTKFVDALTASIKKEHGNDIDLISFFPAKGWKDGQRRLFGVRPNRKSNGYNTNATRRSRSKYYGTAEHEDLHAIDELIFEHAGIRLEILFKVKDFDDDIVHRSSSKRSYNFDDVWKKIHPYLNTALTIRRKVGKVETVPVATKELYKPKNFAIHELVPPALLSRVGEDVCWQMFDERLLKNLQWLRDRFGPTYVNIRGRFSYRGFDDGSYRSTGTSQHNHGRAIDCHFRDYTIAQVHDILKKEYTKMPEPNIWIEGTHNGKPIGWLHMDVRYSDKKGIYFFNA